MIRIFITAVLYLISFFTQAQVNSEQAQKESMENGVNLMAIVKEVSPREGTVYFALYASAEDFSNRKPIQVKNKAAGAERVAVTFDAVPPGTYAITCYHDKNNNQKMDFSANGMPEEDYGSSNNVMNFGPPRFDDAKFEVKDKDLTFEIIF